MSLPKVKPGIHLTALGSETVVYLQSTGALHCLSEWGGRVIQACSDEVASPVVLEQMKEAGLECASDVLDQCLSELYQLDLLQPTDALSRRNLITVGAHAAVGILVASTLAPAPAAATSSVCPPCVGLQEHQLLATSFNENSGTAPIHPGTLCIGGNPHRVELFAGPGQPYAGTGLVFDETVTVRATSPSMATNRAGDTNYQLTHCDGVDPTKIANDSDHGPQTLDVSHLFKDSHGRWNCGNHSVGAHHCNLCQCFWNTSDKLILTPGRAGLSE